MPKRRKKRGRPRTGRDPMIGVRLPARMVKKIGKLAEALSTDRSGAVRWLLGKSLDSGYVSALLRQSLGRGKTGRIVHAHTAKIKSEAAQAAADRDPENAEAQAKASRAKREAIDRERAVTDPQYARSSRFPAITTYPVVAARCVPSPSTLRTVPTPT